MGQIHPLLLNRPASQPAAAEWSCPNERRRRRSRICFPWSRTSPLKRRTLGQRCTPVRSRAIGRSAREPRSGAGFRWKRLKLFLGLHETLRSWLGCKVITTRRFTRADAGRNSWCHPTRERSLEPCSPTSKYATCTRSLPWAKS
jgi:hypothetical protein